MEEPVLKRKKRVTFGRVRVRVFLEHNSEEEGAGDESLTEKNKPGCGVNESGAGVKRNPSKTPEPESTKKPKAKLPTRASNQDDFTKPFQKRKTENAATGGGEERTHSRKEAQRCEDECSNYDKTETKSILKRNIITDKMDKATKEPRRKVEKKSRRNYPRESKDSLTRTEKLKTDNICTSKKPKEKQIKQAITASSIEKEKERATTEIQKLQNEEVRSKDINNNTVHQDIDFENNNVDQKTVLESKRPKDTEKWPGVRNIGVMKELQGSTGVYSGVEVDWTETKKSLLKIGVEVGEDKLPIPSEFIAIMKKLITSKNTEEESKCEKSSRISRAASFQDEMQVPESASPEQTFQERRSSEIPGMKPRVSEDISENCETHADDNEQRSRKGKKATKRLSVGEKLHNYKVKKREGRRMKRSKSEGSLDSSEKSQNIKESSRGKSCSVDDVRRVQGKHGDIKSVEGVGGGKRQKSLIKSFWDRIKMKRSKNERIDVGSEVVEKERGITELEKDDGQKTDVEEENVPTLLRISRTKVSGTKGKQFMKLPEKNGMDSAKNEATGLSQETPERSKKIRETNAVENTKHAVRIKRRRKLGVAGQCNTEAIKVGKSYQIKEVGQAGEANDTMEANQNAEETNHVEKDTEFPEGNRVERANQVQEGNHVGETDQVPKASHVGEAIEVDEADHVEQSSAAAIANYVERVHQILEASDVERSDEILEADHVEGTCQVKEDDVLGVKKVETSDFCSQTEHEMDWLDNWTVIEMEQNDDDSKALYVEKAKQTENGGTTRTKRTKLSGNRGTMPVSSEINRDTNTIINAISMGYEMCAYVPPLGSNLNGGAAFQPAKLLAGIPWFTKSSS